MQLTLTAGGEHDTMPTGPVTLQNDNAASGTNCMLPIIGDILRGDAIKQTTLLTGYQVTQTAVGGFHRCGEGQFLRAGG